MDSSGIPQVYGLGVACWIERRKQAEDGKMRFELGLMLVKMLADDSLKPVQALPVPRWCRMRDISIERVGVELSGKLEPILGGSLTGHRHLRDEAHAVPTNQH